MLRKTLLYLSSFIILLLINVFLTFLFVKQTQHKQATEKLLNEIAFSKDPQKQFSQSAAPMILGTYDVQVKLQDARVANLKSFFRKYNSPLYDHADVIVAVSDKYQFDYRLLPAIAMQESNLCRVIPDNSYNCWGWGIYGTLVTRFDSYPEAIDTVARGIKKEYIDKGLITASSIMQKYTPSSNGSWAHGVNTFLKALE